MRCYHHHNPSNIFNNYKRTSNSHMYGKMNINKISEQKINSKHHFSLPSVYYVHNQNRLKHSVLSTKEHDRRGKQLDMIKNIDKLIESINNLQTDNDEIFLIINLNELFECGKGCLIQLISMTNLIDSIVYIYSIEDISNTCQKGKKRIYFIFTSKRMFRFIRTCGIISFNEVSTSNR